jgi:hypothetical protein
MIAALAQPRTSQPPERTSPVNYERIFRHNDAAHLEELLAVADGRQFLRRRELPPKSAGTGDGASSVTRDE